MNESDKGQGRCPCASEVPSVSATSKNMVAGAHGGVHCAWEIFTRSRRLGNTLGKQCDSRWYSLLVFTEQMPSLISSINDKDCVCFFVACSLALANVPLWVSLWPPPFHAHNNVFFAENTDVVALRINKTLGKHSRKKEHSYDLIFLRRPGRAREHGAQGSP